MAVCLMSVSLKPTYTSERAPSPPPRTVSPVPANNPPSSPKTLPFIKAVLIFYPSPYTLHKKPKSVTLKNRPSAGPSLQTCPIKQVSPFPGLSTVYSKRSLCSPKQRYSNTGSHSLITRVIIHLFAPVLRRKSPPMTIPLTFLAQQWQQSQPRWTP